MTKIAIDDIVTHLDLTTAPEEIAALPFGEAVWPWMQAARKQLLQAVPHIHSLMSRRAYLSLEKSLAIRLSAISSHSLLLELGIKKLEGVLEGGNPRERFLDFIKQLACDKQALSSFFAEYNVLASAIGSILKFWVDQSAAFVKRFENDRKVLSEEFNGGKALGKIASLSLNAGDVHNQGSAVMIVGFAKGKKIVYKPKSIALTKAFHELLEKLSQSNLSPSLKGYKVIVRDDYGWEEMVEQKPVRSKEEIERFYERSGMLLALLYLLEGTDVHCENYIASGEHPYIIDLETLFSPRLKVKNQDGADRLFSHSVLLTGMLPIFYLGKDGKRGPDISALGFAGKETISTPFWENINTDEMKLQEKPVEISHKSPHNLIYQKSIVRAQDHETSILRGFEKLYGHVLTEKEGILEWLTTLDDVPVRYVFRPTMFYYLLLNQIFHPQVYLNKEALQTQLSILDGAIENEQAYLQPMIDLEKKQLLENDIPFFHSYVNSSDIYNSGKILVQNCLEKAPIENVRAMLKQGCEKECKLQISYIKQAFNSKKSIFHQEKHKKVLKKAAGPVEDERIWQAVFDIANRLKDQALLSDEGSMSWLYLEPDPTRNCYTFQPSSETLYSGRAGIALFFAALSHLTKDPQWEKVAMDTLIGIRKKLEKKNPVPMFDFGGFSGIGGVIYALVNIGKLLEKEELIDEALSLATKIEEKHVKFDVQFDMIGGCAGVILPLLSLYDVRKDQALLSVMHLCAKHLCDKAQLLEGDAAAWQAPRSIAPMLGFSHGVAGIAYALFKLGTITNHSRYIEVAQAGLRYERSCFSAEHNNWPRFEKKITYPSSWCHGACGIGMGRMASLPFVQDAVIPSEIDIAVKTTEKLLCLGELSLCCGLFGRLALLQMNNSPSHQKAISSSIASALHYLESKEGSEFNSPGLMKGLSGIGYGLLSYLDKKRVLPEVLILK